MKLGVGLAARLAAGVGIWLLVCPAAAAAEENGILIGAGRLHPSLSVRAQYDTRVLVPDTGAGEVADLILQIRPGLTFTTESSMVAFDVRAMGDLNIFMGLVSKSSKQLTYFGGDLDLNLTINPEGQVGFSLSDRFARSDRTTALAFPDGVRSIYNEVSVALPIRPGGGALEFKPGFTFALEAFEELVPGGPAQNPESLNYKSYKPSFEVKWKFLPKTAFVLDARAEIRQYDQSGNVDVNAFSTRAGLSGLITTKLTLVLLAGYANTFIPQSAGVKNYSNAVGQAELGYVASETARLKLGYTRTVTPTPGSFVWYGDNRIYAGGSILLNRRLRLGAGVSFDLVSFTGGARTDIVGAVDGTASFRVTEWLSIGADYQVEIRGAETTVDSYVRHRIAGFIEARY